jgi:hypothetical protein
MKRLQDVSDDRLVADISAAANAETDAVFDEERLAAQRSKILQRIARVGEAARVIVFPNVAPSAARLFRARPSSRWVAAAAAAGLAVGLLVGRLSTTGQPGEAQRNLTASARIEPAPSAFLPAAIRLSDDEFLGQVERAAIGPASVFLALHEITPTANQFDD